MEVTINNSYILMAVMVSRFKVLKLVKIAATRKIISIFKSCSPLFPWLTAESLHLYLSKLDRSQVSAFCITPLGAVLFIPNPLSCYL